MSDPKTSAEVEDVLSSIRKLVSNEERIRSDKAGGEPFLLSPNLRVYEGGAATRTHSGDVTDDEPEAPFLDLRDQPSDDTPAEEPVLLKFGFPQAALKRDPAEPVTTPEPDWDEMEEGYWHDDGTYRGYRDDLVDDEAAPEKQEQEAYEPFRPRASGYNLLPEYARGEEVSSPILSDSDDGVMREIVAVPRIETRDRLPEAAEVPEEEELGPDPFTNWDDVDSAAATSLEAELAGEAPDPEEAEPAPLAAAPEFDWQSWEEGDPKAGGLKVDPAEGEAPEELAGPQDADPVPPMEGAADAWQTIFNARADVAEEQARVVASEAIGMDVIPQSAMALDEGDGPPRPDFFDDEVSPAVMERLNQFPELEPEETAPEPVEEVTAQEVPVEPSPQFVPHPAFPAAAMPQQPAVAQQAPQPAGYVPMMMPQMPYGTVPYALVQQPLFDPNMLREVIREVLREELAAHLPDTSSVSPELRAAIQREIQRELQSRFVGS